MHCGIEFEYLLIDRTGPTAGRIRDFSNLPFTTIQPLLERRPGRGDPGLASGDLGIRSGYWYLEGDERFLPDGRFHTLAVKGVEIRTPPAEDVAQAVARLLAIEQQLSDQLAPHGLGLGIVGFNPLRAIYPFDPPLNPWQQALRQADRGYDGSHISTLSYGPDINLSLPGWTATHALAAARRLNRYAPYIVPFSFHSPFAAGALWPGYSRRSYERPRYRPAVKLYLGAAELTTWGPRSQLLYPARLPREEGRIEFKAFDALPSPRLLTALCHLLEGICLADELAAADEACDLPLYRRAALTGFDDPHIHTGAREVLACAKGALLRQGATTAVRALAPLEQLLAERRTPAHSLREQYCAGGAMYHEGGLVAAYEQELTTTRLPPSSSTPTSPLPAPP